MGQTLSDKELLQFKSSFYEACREKIRGNIDRAEELFKECLRIDPSNPVAKYELAGIYRFSGLYENALALAKEAAAADEKNEWYQLLMIECLHQKRMYNEAIAGYEKLLRQFPTRAEYYDALANEYIFAGKLDKAAEAYTKLESINGKSESTSIEKVKIYKQLKKYTEAEKELRELIKDYPQEEKYYTYLAELYQELGKLDKAYAVYQDALKVAPGNPYIHLALADYFRIQKDQKKFYEELKIAFSSEELEIDSKIKIMISFYSLTEEMKDKTFQAYELCDVLIKTHPTNPKAYSVQADFLFRDKKYKEARDAFLKVIELDKSKFVIWSQLLICESELQETDAQIEHSSQAIDLFPNQPLPYYIKGISLFKKKQYEAAIESLTEGQQFVVENQPLLLQFLVVLAEVYQADKKYDLSFKTFEEALQLDQNNPLLLNNYAYFLALRKSNLDKAMKLSEVSLEKQPNNPSFLDTKGFIYFQTEKFEEAKNFLEKAFQQGGEKNGAIAEHLGDALFKLGKHEDAVLYWKRAKANGITSEILEKKIKNQQWYAE